MKQALAFIRNDQECNIKRNYFMHHMYAVHTQMFHVCYTMDLIEAERKRLVDKREIYETSFSFHKK